MTQRLTVRRSITCCLAAVLFHAAQSDALAAKAFANPRVMPNTRPAPAPPPMKAQFNRQTIGVGSGVSPGLRGRAYSVIDGTQKGGRKTRPYLNDGTKPGVVLPKQTAAGKPITYQATNLRAGDHSRKASNARVIRGSDGSAYVSRHYGEKGGQVERIQ